MSTTAEIKAKLAPLQKEAARLLKIVKELPEYQAYKAANAECAPLRKLLKSVHDEDEDDTATDEVADVIAPVAATPTKKSAEVTAEAPTKSTKPTSAPNGGAGGAVVPKNLTNVLDDAVTAPKPKKVIKAKKA